MQYGSSFYLVLATFIFFDVAYASLTLSVQQPPYRLVLQDVGILISEDTFASFQLFKTIKDDLGESFENKFIVENIPLTGWKMLNKPFFKADSKKYFKKFNVADLHTIKVYYDYLQMNNPKITNALDYIILKKILPKGTLGLFKRSIASEIFYRWNSSNHQLESDFNIDLQNQFGNFITYCTLLWQKGAPKDLISVGEINVSAVLQDKYCESSDTAVLQDMPTNDVKYIFKDIFRFSTQQDGAIQETEKINILSNYLAKKIFLNNNELNLSFVMISKNLKHYGYPSFLSYWLSKDNMSQVDTDFKLSSVHKVVYCYTKNVTFAELREDCNNISSMECIALDNATFSYIQNTSLSPVFWKHLTYDFKFKPIQTITVAQQSNEKLYSHIAELEKQHYTYKKYALQCALHNTVCTDSIVYSLGSHHFLMTCMSGGLSALCIVPIVINKCGVILDAQLLSDAQWVAGELLRRHKITKLSLPLFLLYRFVFADCVRQHSNHWNAIEDIIQKLFWFISMVDYIYYFYGLYQAGIEAWALYDWIYIILLPVACGIAVGDMIERHEKIACDFKTLWRILWHTKCPQVIINE